MKIAVILGSSRSDGNTRQLADEFTSQANAVFFNLADYDISAYDYMRIEMMTSYPLLVS